MLAKLLVPPEITLPLVDMTINETDNVDFVCRGFGEPFPDIRWYFNGAMISLSEQSKYGISLFPLDQNILSILFVINVQSSDVGTYTCETVNIIGTDQTSGILTVNGIHLCNCRHVLNSSCVFIIHSCC